MTLPVVLTPAAADEFEAAVAWYEGEQVGTGARFRDAVLAVIRSVQNHPHAYPRVHHGIRRARVRAFPYVVLYTIEPVRIRIIAIFHAHRNPADWQSRPDN